MSDATHLWTYAPDVWVDGRDVLGYDVEATDGEIGKIDESTIETDQQHVVVDTGFWIFGKRRLIPAGAVTRIDHDDSRVYVRLTKDQIKDAPDYDDVLDEAEDNRRERIGVQNDFYTHMRW